MPSGSDKAQAAGAGCVLFFVLFLLVGWPIVYRLAGTDAETITVKKLEQVKKSDTGKYLVFTERGEVFEITDTVMFGRWDSSDLYGRMEPGKTYKVRAAGWRVSFFSLYRNIITADEVVPETPKEAPKEKPKS